MTEDRRRFQLNPKRLSERAELEDEHTDKKRVRVSKLVDRYLKKTGQKK